ncbi:FUSC family protein [Ancylobacter sp. VNQ12]|uniref:FUSC family protein n=1 Tax=Ancylobacter sp. VNQ12 TaxID=3400920 RepID=UPI003C0F7F6F
MKLPSWRDWLFSAKAFIAVMLALYIALLMDLPRPYWAMTTVYVVAHPLAGATSSKALYRALGTVLGAVGTVVLVPTFVNVPELLTVAVAAWVGGLLYLALLDRTLRSYVFMLAAYTLPIIALPAVTTPETIFDVALARSEEIVLGILCASIVSAIAFPESVGPALAGRVSGWLRETGAWAADILRGSSTGSAAPVQQKLAADVAILDALIIQLSYDPSARDLLRSARELRGRLLLLLPVLSAVSDRMSSLERERRLLAEGAGRSKLITVGREVADWIAAGPDGLPSAFEHLRGQIARAAQDQDGPGQWRDLLHANVCARLTELVNLWQDCLVLHAQIARGPAAGRWKPVLRHRPIIGRSRHHDHGLMAFAAGSAALATATASALWIASGWPGGANFVAMAAVACCFFGPQDRPAPFIWTMVVWCAVAQTIAGVLLFVVLPRVHDFEMLVLVFAPPFLLVGAFIPRPELALITLLLAANGAGSLSVQSHYNADFTLYANEGLAVVGGLMFAWVWMLVTKPFGAAYAARRLVHAGWADLAATAAGTRRQDHGMLVSRSLDRLGQLVPRLASGAITNGRATDGLRDLRIGYNVLDLQRDRRRVPDAAKERINGVLLGVAEHYRAQVDAEKAMAPPASLLERIDEALAAALAQRAGLAADDALQALVGLRCGLFPDAVAPLLPPPRVAEPPVLLAAE